MHFIVTIVTGLVVLSSTTVTDKMKLLRVIVPWTTLLSTSLAQQDFLSQLPSCAVRLCFRSAKRKTNVVIKVQCLEAALPTTTCSPTDLTCLCLDTPFLDTVAACNAVNCTVVETLRK